MTIALATTIPDPRRNYSELDSVGSETIPVPSAEREPGHHNARSILLESQSIFHNQQHTYIWHAIKDKYENLLSSAQSRDKIELHPPHNYYTYLLGTRSEKIRPNSLIEVKTTALPSARASTSHVLPEAVLDRLNWLSELEDEWQGAGSSAATKDTISDAEGLLSKLYREVPEPPTPSIGLDSDGFIVMSWSSDQLFGSLSIFGDGTYAYYIERSEKKAKQSDAKINAPLPPKLKEILIG